MVKQAGNAKKTKKRVKREGFGAGWIIAFSLVLAVGLGAFSWHQVVRYGDNVIDIFATQQDAYVQLVLDQINLRKDGSSEDIVSGILSTIDSSNSEFWTLSRAESLIYVKDVAESNRYRGFSDDTYYNTESAQQFIKGLTLNKVQHSIISIDDRRFIISGVAFQYGGSTYRMCLLTSEHVVMDSNAYLASRVNLGIAIAACLSAMVLMTLVVALRGEKWKRKTYEVEDENVELRETIEQLNAQMYQEGLYDVRNSLFDEAAAAVFVDKLVERKQVPSSFVYMVADDPSAEQVLLTEATRIFGNRLVKFRLQDGVAMAFVGFDCPATVEALSALTVAPQVVRSLILVLTGAGVKWDDIRAQLLTGERVRMADPEPMMDHQVARSDAVPPSRDSVDVVPVDQGERPDLDKQAVVVDLVPSDDGDGILPDGSDSDDWDGLSPRAARKAEKKRRKAQRKFEKKIAKLPEPMLEMTGKHSRIG